MTNSDISFTFSGGSSNSNANNSLGGESSNHFIGKRIFSDISINQARVGKIDYRCFYLHNDHATETIINPEISVVYTQNGDSTVELGFLFANDIQTVTVTNADLITSGYFTVNDIIVNWNSDLTTWASNFQTGLRTLYYLADVTVTASESGSSVIFEVIFDGTAGNRFHEIMEIENNLSPGSVNITVAKTTDGSPVNNTTDEIDVETTTPFNITFYSEPIEIGDIRPLDSIPIWLKRTVPPNSGALIDDGFTLRIRGSAGLNPIIEAEEPEEPPSGDGPSLDFSIFTNSQYLAF